jgi:hypothetical protein
MKGTKPHRRPATTLFRVGELWQWWTDESTPKELAMGFDTCREENLVIVTCTQHPQLVNASITGACTELVAFRLNEPDALRVVGKLGANRDNVQHLAPGWFFSYGRLKGGIRGGRVF